jgi:hypothetical protein
MVLARHHGPENNTCGDHTEERDPEVQTVEIDDLRIRNVEQSPSNRHGEGVKTAH